MGTVLEDRRGASLIAAVFIILVLAFLGAVVVDLVTTSTRVSTNEYFSSQALFIADGGIEFVLGYYTFPNYSDPPWSTRTGASVSNPCPQASARALGNGVFCVDPPTVLTSGIDASATTIPVVSTGGFPARGMIRINAELIRYDSVTATSFVLNNANRRGQAGTSASSHSQDDAVYPASILRDNLPNNCTALASVRVRNPYPLDKFLSSGVFKIDSEYFHYTSRTTTAFNNVTRCFRGSSAASHSAGTPVYQQAIASTGTVSAGGQTFQRTVRVTVDR